MKTKDELLSELRQLEQVLEHRTKTNQNTVKVTGDIKEVKEKISIKNNQERTERLEEKYGDHPMGVDMMSIWEQYRRHWAVADSEFLSWRTEHPEFIDTAELAKFIKRKPVSWSKNFIARNWYYKLFDLRGQVIMKKWDVHKTKLRKMDSYKINGVLLTDIIPKSRIVEIIHLEQFRDLFVEYNVVSRCCVFRSGTVNGNAKYVIGGRIERAVANFLLGCTHVRGNDFRHPVLGKVRLSEEGRNYRSSLGKKRVLPNTENPIQKHLNEVAVEFLGGLYSYDVDAPKRKYERKKQTLEEQLQELEEFWDHVKENTNPGDIIEIDGVEIQL
ncbi:hypothetical protein [Endozoicomonas sp. ALB115]|uniref:hypothetical protein n=1 Tax=Endozoicomonas sp. ALB115 TaxID=3403074 RepID=UPI003BB57773